ncbi:MAG: hypothetical protein J6Y89_08675 [Lachnospiraceae bacterium]|nr:hypothetical protein [Lachnospiraceae bacterium]
MGKIRLRNDAAEKLCRILDSAGEIYTIEPHGRLPDSCIITSEETISNMGSLMYYADIMDEQGGYNKPPILPLSVLSNDYLIEKYFPYGCYRIRREEFETFKEERGIVLSDNWRQPSNNSLPQSMLTDRITKEGYMRATKFTIGYYESLVTNLVTENRKFIDKWLKAEDDTYCILRHEYDKEIGIGYAKHTWHDWKHGPIKCHILESVLARRIDSSGRSAEIICAYPHIKRPAWVRKVVKDGEEY